MVGHRNYITIHIRNNRINAIRHYILHAICQPVQTGILIAFIHAFTYQTTVSQCFAKTGIHVDGQINYCMSKSNHTFLLKLLLPAGMIFCSSSANALGLGAMDVQSRLGEPLRATVQLFDIPKRLDTTCFRLLRGNDDFPASPLNASLSLRENPDGNASLNIRSYQALNDPIVQLSLIAECENQISREYVLLLDPPQTVTATPQTESASPQTAITPDAIAELAEESKTPSVIPTAGNTSVSKARPAKTEARTKKPIARNRNPDQTAQAVAAVTATPADMKPAESGAPRLMISGAEPLHTDFFNAPLQLQMSMELNEWPATDMPPLSAEDVSDEMTAMTNKLAHLESQIIALQKRNAELETLRTAGPTSTSDNSWLMYTLLTLLIIVLIGVAEWLRRRHSRQQIATELAIWDKLAPEIEQSVFDTNRKSASSAETDEITNTTELEPASQHMPDFKSRQTSLQTPEHGHAGTTVNEDILEQAEVFVAHGRANLAIVLLQDHLAEFPDLSPEPWLMLLDLLKRDGQTSEYEAATAECKRHFNVAIADFDEPLQEDFSSIEDYPHVTAQLQRVWGSAEALPFLDDLIFNRRLEARQGFGRNAYLEILLLRSMLGDLNFAISQKSLNATGAITSNDMLPQSQDVMKTIATKEDMLPNPQNAEKAGSANQTEEHLFTDQLASTSLPEDKSKPLEFEFTVRN